MINYEEELKKFQPCLDVDDAEGDVYKRQKKSSEASRLP